MDEIGGLSIDDTTGWSSLYIPSLVLSGVVR